MGFHVYFLGHSEFLASGDSGMALLKHLGGNKEIPVMGINRKGWGTRRTGMKAGKCGYNRQQNFAMGQRR
jgi:hypothetical protein